ncbi:MAG: MXAN_6640 family putative metalloprotease, partial [Bacteroidota bacterium]
MMRTATLVAALWLQSGFAYGQEGRPAGESDTSATTREAVLLELASSIPGHRPGDAVKCGLPLITDALRAWEEKTLTPESPLSILLARPALQTSRVSGNFRIHFDTTGTHAPAMLNSFYLRIEGTHHEYVDSLFSMLQYVSSLLTVSLGYLPPPSDGALGGGPEYDIYLMELGNLYGETIPDYGIPTGDTVSTFIRMDNDYQFVTPSRNRGMPGLRVSAAHEFFHAIQIGRYGYWWAEDVYFYEISSTWIEDVAYTDVNDYLGYVHATWSHFHYPETEFASRSNLIMYSRGIWGQYVEKRIGIDAMRRSWEYVRQGRPVVAMDNALREYGSSLPEGFAEWTLWNHFTWERSDPIEYYPEGGAFPTIAHTPVEFTPPTRQMTGSLRSLSARYYEVLHGGDTVTVAVTNTNHSAS